MEIPMTAITDREKKVPRFKLSAATLILSIAVGIILSYPLKVIQKSSSEPLPNDSRQELTNRILKITEENDQLRIELTQVRDQSNQLEENLMQRDQASVELTESRRTYRLMAGLDAVHGPGVKLTLMENPPEAAEGSEVAPYFIHQEDLLNIVNEMWLAGAEGIAIGSAGKVERLVMTSTIRCVGSLIDVNNTRMTPPFEIYAIGNSEDLYSALTMPGGVLEPLKYFNIESSIEKQDDLTLPAFSGSTLRQYARPVGE
jgi:uncharacterized protein YlxW (UPF0749 family)